jgi:hypothetical protein
MMKNLLRSEELAQFLACLLALIASDVSWWVYLLLLLGPDIGMLGYLVDARVGAITYNLLHHKAVALVMVLAGYYWMAVTLFEPGDLGGTALLITGLVLYGHASLDRIFGYGLKFGDNFHHTHLGWFGKDKGQAQAQGQ